MGDVFRVFIATTWAGKMYQWNWHAFNTRLLSWSANYLKPEFHGSDGGMENAAHDMHMVKMSRRFNLLVRDESPENKLLTSLNMSQPYPSYIELVRYGDDPLTTIGPAHTLYAIKMKASYKGKAKTPDGQMTHAFTTHGEVQEIDYAVHDELKKQGVRVTFNDNGKTWSP